jgi:preprotein translocase subunit SecG
MLLGLLLTLNILVCLALIGVVLLQRSEGGALGGGGGPTGLVTTRGAGDLLTRTTWVLFALFLTLSLSLTLLGGRERSSQAIINRLKLQSINPDTLTKRNKAALAGEAANGAAPGQATPPPVQAASGPAALPPAAPKPSVRLPTTNTAPAPAPSNAPMDFSTPAPVVSLPPMPMASKPAKP